MQRSNKVCSDEGKKRSVMKIEQMGFDMKNIMNIAGPKKMPNGEYRWLKSKEVRELLKARI